MWDNLEFPRTALSGEGRGLGAGGFPMTPVTRPNPSDVWTVLPDPCVPTSWLETAGAGPLRGVQRPYLRKRNLGPRPASGWEGRRWKTPRAPQCRGSAPCQPWAAARRRRPRMEKGLGPAPPRPAGSEPEGPAGPAGKKGACPAPSTPSPPRSPACFLGLSLALFPLSEVPCGVSWHPCASEAHT